MKKTLALTVILTTSILMIKIISIPPILPQEDKLNELLSITIENEKPNGCVDCHKLRPEIGRDLRLSRELPNDRNHLEVGNAVANSAIPLICKNCHMNKLASQIHLIHLTGELQEENTKENLFTTSYQRQCFYCHDLDIDNGNITIKTGYETST